MLKKLLFALLSVCCLFAAGCGGDVVFEKSIDIPEGNWRYDKPLVFDFEIPDTSARYDLLLDVHHAGDYGFQNLYVQFLTTFPSGKKDAQVVSLELSEKTGLWNGDCSSNHCTVQIPLQVKAFFDEVGKHQISVEQYMRKDPLPGVEGMTLVVRRVKGAQTQTQGANQNAKQPD